jgi:DNA-binding XRE family transcriptional regulator
MPSETYKPTRPELSTRAGSRPPHGACAGNILPVSRATPLRAGVDTTLAKAQPRATSAAAGVSARTIYNIEVERRNPRRATKRVLCFALDAPWKMSFRTHATPPDPNERPEMRLLLDDYRAGRLRPRDVRLGEMPTYATPLMRTIAADMRLRIGLRLAVDDDRPLPLCNIRGGRRWAGAPQDAGEPCASQARRGGGHRRRRKPAREVVQGRPNHQPSEAFGERAPR